MLPKRYERLCLLALVVSLAMICFLAQYLGRGIAPKLDKGKSSKTDSLTSSSHSSQCYLSPSAKDIAIVVKTGATEAFEKVPNQLLTFLRCVDDPLIFSDMEQEIGAYHVYDALDQVNDSAKNDNKDFDIYRMQQILKNDGVGVQKTLLGAKPDAAWNLDKYKNIHIARKAYQMRPHALWYVFIDADTYVVVSSLLRWLERLDPTKPLYMGAVWLHGKTPFAQGGSGYVLSAKLMEELLGKDPDISHRFDEKAKGICCGDVNLALAIYESNISKVLGVGPMVYSDTIATLSFGPKLWCQPSVTMHHIMPADINQLWQYEQSRPDPSQPLLFKEIYENFVKPRLRDRRSAWDNYAKDVEFYESAENKKDWTDIQHKSWWSYDDCRKACADDKGCMMFAYHRKEKKCSLSWGVRSGMCQPLGTPEDEKIESGWMVDRIEQFTSGLGSCKEPEWVIGK